MNVEARAIVAAFCIICIPRIGIADSIPQDLSPPRSLSPPGAHAKNLASCATKGGLFISTFACGCSVDDSKVLAYGVSFSSAGPPAWLLGLSGSLTYDILDKGEYVLTTTQPWETTATVFDAYGNANANGTTTYRFVQGHRSANIAGPRGLALIRTFDGRGPFPDSCVLPPVVPVFSSLTEARGFMSENAPRIAIEAADAAYTGEIAADQQIFRTLSGDVQALAIVSASDPDHVFVSFRGTSEAAFVSNWIANFGFLGVGDEAQLRQYVSAASAFVDSVSKDQHLAGRQIVLTGHSLGGGLATILGYYSGYDSIAFNAPNIGNVVGQLAGETSIISNRVQQVAHNHLVNVGVEGDPISNLLPLARVGQSVTIESDPFGAYVFRAGVDVTSKCGLSGHPPALCLALGSIAGALTFGGNLLHNHYLPTLADRMLNSPTVLCANAMSCPKSSKVVNPDEWVNQVLLASPSGIPLQSVSVGQNVVGGRLHYIWRDPTPFAGGRKISGIELETGNVILDIVAPVVGGEVVPFRVQKFQEGRWIDVAIASSMELVDLGATDTSRVRMIGIPASRQPDEAQALFAGVVVASSGSTLFKMSLVPSDTLIFDAEWLSYGEHSVGATSRPQTVTITNTGSGPATIISIVTSSEFGQTNNCPATLAPTAMCTITATFTPAAAGLRSGSITISDNASGSPHAIALSGYGRGGSADTDDDGVPNAVEPLEGLNPAVKDNDVFTNNRLFAMQQYRDFLAREGDADGILYWTNYINGGGTRAAVTEGFFGSSEFQGTGSPVVRLYFAYFLRIPDYGGLAFWMNYSRAGHPLVEISNAFAGSQEFVDRYGALSNDAFVDLVYQNVLGRAPDTGGRAFWLGQLNGGMTRGQMMIGFSESPEYKSTIFSETYVTMMYVGMLRRAPDSGGFNFWVNYLDRGNSGQALINGFLVAPEYHSRFLP